MFSARYRSHIQDYEVVGFVFALPAVSDIFINSTVPELRYIPKICVCKVPLEFVGILSSILVSPKISIVDFGVMDASENAEIMNMRGFRVLP